MKKILAILCFAVLLLLPLSSYGAGSSMTVTNDTGPIKNAQTGDVIRVITVTFVADDNDGSIPDLTLNNVTTGINRYYPLTGWSIFQVIIDGDHAGAHDGDDDADTLSDTDAGFDADQWVGYTVTNSTDSSSGAITANTSSTVTATLSGGTDNDWDDGDSYTIATEPTENSDLYIYQGGRDILEGNGVDQVDNTTERSIFCLINSQPATPPIISDLVITLTQATAVTNDAVGTIKLILY